MLSVGLCGAHGVMVNVLQDLLDEDLYPDQGFIDSRDVIGVKYLDDDGRTHIVVIPSNTEQHSVLTKIYGDSELRSEINHNPKVILEKISEHYRDNLCPDGTIYTPQALDRQLTLQNGDIPEQYM